MLEQQLWIRSTESQRYKKTIYLDVRLWVKQYHKWYENDQGNQKTGEKDSWASSSLGKIFADTHTHPLVNLSKLEYLRLEKSWHFCKDFKILRFFLIFCRFNNLKGIIDEIIDIECIAETKIDKIFVTAQQESTILPQCRKSFLLDVNDRSGRLLVFLKFNLLSRQLIKYEISNAIELVHFVMNLRKEKIVAYIQTSLQNNLYFSKQLIILFKILRVITSVFLIIS